MVLRALVDARKAQKELDHLAVSTLFVTTASTETLNGTIWGVTSFRGRNKSYIQSRTV